MFDGDAGPALHSQAAVVHARTLESLEPLGVVGEMLGGASSSPPDARLTPRVNDLRQENDPN